MQFDLLCLFLVLFVDDGVREALYGLNGGLIIQLTPRDEILRRIQKSIFIVIALIKICPRGRNVSVMKLHRHGEDKNLDLKCARKYKTLRDVAIAVMYSNRSRKWSCLRIIMLAQMRKAKLEKALEQGKSNAF